ncbi:MAG: hypothetical protein H6841_09445 [Planctomycetes bacterium]|nr:hypothetical protein [Planctomycetota bacterium]MCB9934458.1 hypothetical protein [Planctomycetota bacterium]
MLRLLCLVCLLCPPLWAVAPERGTSLTLESAQLEVRLLPAEDGVNAEVTCRITVRNDGDALDASMELPDDFIPLKQREAFTLQVDGKAEAPDKHESRAFHWTLHFANAATRELSWSYTCGTTLLPHVHILGRRELRVRLSHLRGYAALPESVPVTVNIGGQQPELFGQATDGPLSLTHTAGAPIQDFSFSWFASTIAARTAVLAAQRDSTGEAQRTAANSSWTATLADLADLQALAGDHEALAATCETLAGLERESGQAITHCGPGAQWRHYVPWELRRLQALEAAGADTKPCAAQARSVLEARWPAYLQARVKLRPFDHFDFVKFGSYWDYDWPRTRDLYARALEILGESEAARTVKETED